MDNSILNLIKALDQDRPPEEADDLIEQLAQKGEIVIPELMEHFTDSPFQKSRRLHLVKILHKLGYPANKSALLFIVGEVSDINAPGWEVAISALQEAGKYAIPVIREAINFYLENIKDHGSNIQGICQFIEESLDPELRLSLLPELMQLLEIGTDENFVDLYALDAIRKIGSPQANVAIPVLLKKIVSKRKDLIRYKAIEALANFDPLIVKLSIPVLKECLKDDSKRVRDNARNILVLLGEI